MKKRNKSLYIVVLIIFPLINACFTFVKREDVVIRNWVYWELEKAAKQQEANKLEEAEDILLSMLRNKNKRLITFYEEAFIYSFLGSVSYSKKDYNSAIAYYKKIVGLEHIPNENYADAEWFISRLYIITGNFSDSLKHYDVWFALVDSPDAIDYLCRGRVKFRLGDFAGALSDMKMAESSDSLSKELRANLRYEIRSIEKLINKKNHYKNIRI